MKVLIADDEDRVCRLICRLIKWEELDMEVAAVAHNGLEVLSMIEEHRPDIVITDIRMPGLDGLEMIKRAKELDHDLEFIIISGYRHFEYAQNALRYGARDYLLKPVKEAELYSVLKRMRDNYQMRHDQITQEEKYKVLMQNNRDRLRTTFFNDVVLKHSVPEKIKSLEWINETYHYEFSPGYFQIVILKVDSIVFNREENLDYIQKKIVDLAGKKLDSLCYDKEFFLEESRCMILLNYMPEKEMEIYKAFKSLINELMLQNDIFESLKVTAGLGSAEKEPKNICRSVDSALWAMEQRLILGGNRVIEGAKVSSNDFVDSKLFYEFNKNLSEGLEDLDEKRVEEALIFLREGLFGRQDLSGHEVLQMAREAVNVYLLTMRKNNMDIVLSTGTFEEFSAALNYYGTKEGVFDFVSEVILSSMGETVKRKQEEGKRPIREAKNYIRLHYKEALTLEKVSGIVGLNASYLSALFKKETGKTFLEYLTKVRMDKAKEMLKETNETISTICQEVGYSDTKYFVKSFQKYTGLKPNQYRKVYS